MKQRYGNNFSNSLIGEKAVLFEFIFIRHDGYIAHYLRALDMPTSSSSAIIVAVSMLSFVSNEFVEMINVHSKLYLQAYITSRGRLNGTEMKFQER